MKKYFVILVCVLLFAPSFALAEGEETAEGVLKTIGGFDIVYSKGVNLTVTEAAESYSASSDHSQGTKSYSTTQDTGIEESEKEAG